MLLLSSGDDSASLPTDSLQHQTDVMSERQSSMECDPASLTGLSSTPVSNTIEGDRDEDSVRTSTAFGTAPSGDHTVLRTSTFAPSSHRQSGLLKGLYLPETELDGLYALRQAARLKRQQRVRERESSLRMTLAKLPDAIDEVVLGSYAAPLAPLRERDITALSVLFQRDDIYAIEADVKHRLLALLPEPCWDDDVFAFLHEFL